MLRENHVPGLKTGKNGLEKYFNGYSYVKLTIALYGMRQASAQWYRTLISKLGKLKIIPTFPGSCFLTKSFEGKFIMLMIIHVDDIMIVRSNRFFSGFI